MIKHETIIIYLVAQAQAGRLGSKRGRKQSSRELSQNALRYFLGKISL